MQGKECAVGPWRCGAEAHRHNFGKWGTVLNDDHVPYWVPIIFVLWRAGDESLQTSASHRVKHCRVSAGWNALPLD